MHNTILLTFVLMLTAVSASAQFYTITKETEIKGSAKVQAVETVDIKIDTIVPVDSIHSTPDKSVRQESSRQRVLNTRKSDDYGSSSSENTTSSNEEKTSLPELTIPNLLAEIKKNNIKYPKIVLAQAILETGWFKSSVCRNKHNLFGLTNPRTGQYFEFNHWTESVRAYYTKVQYRYKGGNYLLWLDKIGYAESPGYIRAVISVLRQL